MEACVNPVMRLEARVDTRPEHTGTVRVRKVIHQMAESVSAAGYREVVETTRVPVNRVVQSVKAPWHQGDVLVIPVYEERLDRQLVLLEEIQIAHRRETLQDGATASLGIEEVFVERLTPIPGSGFPSFAEVRRPDAGDAPAVRQRRQNWACATRSEASRTGRCA